MSVSKLSPQDLEDIVAASDYAASKSEKVQELSNSYSNTFWLFTDSKIPENDKRWYYFVRLGCSDRNYILQEMNIYEKFYGNLSNIFKTVKEQRDTDCKDHYDMIQDLKKKLMELVDAAKEGENSTPSSAIYRLHRSFIDEHEKLLSMIKHAESVVTTEGWRKSIQAIKTLREDMKSFEKKMDEKFSAERKEFLEINKKMQEKQEILIEKNREMQQQGETLLSKHEETQAKNEELLECIRQIEREHQEALLESTKQIKEQQKALMENSNKQMREYQEAFMESIEQMKKDHQEALSQKNREIQQQQQKMLKMFEDMKQQQESFLQQQNNFMQENAYIRSNLETLSIQSGSNEEKKRIFI